MSSDAVSFQQAFTAVMRASGVNGVAWGEGASPFFVDANEPPPAFPYVVFRIEQSSVVHTQDDPYTETLSVAVMVVGSQGDCDPLMAVQANLPTDSVFVFLDKFRGTRALPDGPTAFSGRNFDCQSFERTGYLFEELPERDEVGARVYQATGTYEVVIVVN